MEDYELINPPKDGISRVVFSPNDPSLLLVTSWDKSVRLYDVHAQQMIAKYEHEAAVLDGCLSATHCFSAGLDKRVVMFDWHSRQETVLSQHQEAVRSLCLNEKHQLLISGSWDKTIKIHSLNSLEVTQELKMNGKVYAMCTSGNHLVAALEDRKIRIYDLRNLNDYTEKESGLKYPTRTICAIPNDQGYVLTSIEGRVSVEYFDQTKQQFAFKAHRQVQDNVEIAYPVHSIAFHPGYGTFASGGGDGFVNIWDGYNKKRMRQYSKYETSISSLDLNYDGSILAIAVSYAFEEGEKDHPLDIVYLKSITDFDVRPKNWDDLVGKK